MLNNVNQDLNVRVKVDGTEAAKGKLKGLDGAVGGIVKTLGLAYGASVLFSKGIQLGSQAMAEYKEGIIVNRMIAQQLTATGNAAGIAADELARMATELQASSNMGDEGILRNLTLPLLTFKSISQDVFKRTQQAAIDLNAIIGDPNNATSLRSSAIQLGKALQDPIQGLSALRRVGISFSESQIAIIKNFAETGRLIDAQNMILDELETQFGGAAQAGIDSTMQLKNAWGDYLQGLGGTFSYFDGIKQGFTAALTDMAGQFDTTSRQAQLNSLDMQQRWGEYAIIAVNGVKIGLNLLGAISTAAYNTVVTAGDTMSSLFTSSLSGIVTAIIQTSKFIVNNNPLALLTKGYEAILEKLTGKNFNLDAIIKVQTDALNAMQSKVNPFLDDIMNAVDRSGDRWGKWGSNLSAVFSNASHNMEQQTALLIKNIDRQREAIDKSMGGVISPDIEDQNLQVNITTGDTSTQAAKDYHAEIMALNNTAAQNVIAKHNEMRESYRKYLDDTIKDEAKRTEMMQLGMAEIQKSELTQLYQLSDQAKEEGFKRWNEANAQADAHLASVIESSRTEAETTRLKYDKLRTDTINYYQQQLLTKEEYETAMRAIDAQGLAYQTTLEQSRLDTRLRTLQGLKGFEREYVQLREAQITTEISSLREAGLTEIQIAAYVSQQKKAIQEQHLGMQRNLWQQTKAEFTDVMESTAQALENTLGNAMYNFVSSTKTANEAIKELWHDLANSVLRELSRMIARMTIAAAWQAILGGINLMKMAKLTAPGTFDLIPGGSPGGGGFASYDPGNGFASYNPEQSNMSLQPPPQINTQNTALMSRMDHLISAIENNRPQIYTQKIEGIPFYKAIQNAQRVANEL